MNRVIARLAFASVLLLVIASVAPGAVLAAARGQNQQPLVIAVQPTATPEQLSAVAQELRLFLEQHPSQPVQLVFPTTFAGVIEALRFGHAHAAFMSAWLHRKRWPPSSVV